MDSFFLFNFFVNFWILFLCRLFLRSRVKLGKIIIASLVMAMGECVLLLLPLGNFVFKLLFGFGGGTVMVLVVVFRPKTRWMIYRILLTAYTVALLLGGTLVILQRFFFIGQDTIGRLILSISLLALIMGGGISLVRGERQEALPKVELCFRDGRKKSLTALIDTGNSLREPMSQSPVSLVWEEEIKEYVNSFEDRDFRVIPFSSVGEQRGLLEGYFIKEIIIYGKRNQYTYKNPMIALTKEELSKGKKFQIILHPELIREQEAGQ